MGNIVGGQNVSRETYEELKHFADLVHKWTKKINLISAESNSVLWERHIVDSAQIYDLSHSSTQNWVDLGSGGGFPGIVIAILGKSQRPNQKITLIESDIRKSTFLRTVVRELALSVTVMNKRIEEVVPQQADVVSARALAALPLLLSLVQPHVKKNGTAILLKGKKYDEEIALARKNWSFDLEERPSLTNPESRLLLIQGIARVDK